MYWCHRKPLWAVLCLLTAALLPAGCGDSEKTVTPEVSVQAVTAHNADISRVV